MNKLFFLIFLLPYTTFAQNVLKGKVIDSESGVTLLDVNIINQSNNQGFKTNDQGIFEVSETGTYIFKKTGYQDKVLKISGSFQIIQLNVNPSELNEVIINTNPLPKRLKKSVITTEIISSKDLKRSNDLNLAPVLNKVPGIFMQSGALNTNRITIRGIGARNLFGTAKIRAYFKDIPLTNGSGETNIEDFELAAISRIEIVKGASSIFGAGLGGSIHLTPQSAYLDNTAIHSELSVGSFGLKKGLIAINAGGLNHSLKAFYSNTHSDGYRDNNEYDRQTITLNSNHFIGEKDVLFFLLSYIDLKAFIPSSLDEDTYLNNPSAAAYTWKQAQGFEDTRRGIFGLSWEHQYHANLKHSTSLFSSFKNSFEPRPFDVLDENNFAIGIRSRLIGNFAIFEKRLDWTVGAEVYRDIYKYKTYDNLYQDFPDGTGSVQGEQLTHFKEKRKYGNLFLESNYNLTQKTMISVGLNYNNTSYRLDDRFLSNTEDIDQSGSFKFKGIVSPKFGMSHLFSEHLSFYTNISHGFSPITLQETLLPDGLINQNLKPETGWNFEIGTRGALIHNKLLFNLAIYRLNIKNLLVSRRTAEDQYIGINAGRTQHDGLELSLSYKWFNSEPFTLGAFVNYALNDYKFKEFTDNDANYSGNELTGVPRNVFNAGVDFETKLGFYGHTNFQYVGSMPITDSNSLYSKGYTLTNLKIGYKFDIDKKFNFNLFYGLDNIFNEKYASQILINTMGFGGTAPRYYYPGNPVNYYSGIKFNYTF
ncbi:TonB-dependent receptor [Aestuariivivens sediminis]|uniref:TonB-dependent receptor n=1 Tax=Aestuariivivens sediminis TaxID=2913557 RepID=UPI001F5A0B4A|nr:TonB-dependent receptor [Aestuariivivens sediminis]